VARRFASKNVAVVSTQNQGAPAARNHAFQLSQGDYIQWLDADDLLAQDKIERQLEALGEDDGRGIPLSSQCSLFYYRRQRAQFFPTPSWGDLSPVEWFLAEMTGNWGTLQTTTWLISRELAEAAGPWDARLRCDQDTEYFARVVLASKCIRFVPGAEVLYRTGSPNRVSYIGKSEEKRNSKLLSIKLHVRYVRSLEESERVRKACLVYLQRGLGDFYPKRPDMVAELQALAAELRGHLEIPGLRWKYAWMQPVFGWKAAHWAQRALPQMKASLVRRWDKAMFKLEAREAAVGHVTHPKTVRQEDVAREVGGKSTSAHRRFPQLGGEIHRRVV
jgi:glycosyltransferase involved in cell wall biosynthesis